MPGRILPAVVLLALGAQAQSAKKADTFFAGTVAEIADQAIVVSRTVRGKAEKRTFQLTPETKVEGRLRPRVRVTVRYVPGDEGDTATLIVVRAALPAKKK